MYQGAWGGGGGGLSDSQSGTSQLFLNPFRPQSTAIYSSFLQLCLSFSSSPSYFLLRTVSSSHSSLPGSNY